MSEETLAEYEKRTPGILEARRKVESFTNAQQAAIDWARADFESRMNEHNERIFTAGVGQGRGEGGLLMLSGLVQKGKFTLSEAAEEARMTPEEFTRKVAELRRS